MKKIFFKDLYYSPVKPKECIVCNEEWMSGVISEGKIFFLCGACLKDISDYPEECRGNIIEINNKLIILKIEKDCFCSIEYVEGKTNIINTCKICEAKLTKDSDYCQNCIDIGKAWNHLKYISKSDNIIPISSHLKYKSHFKGKNLKGDIYV